MHIEELYQAVSNMAVVAQHLKEDAENAVQIQQQVAYQLEQRLQVLDESIETALARHVEKLREQVAQQVADGSQDSMQDFEQQLEDLKKQMLDFSQFAAMIKKDLNKVSHSILMKIGVLSSVALVAVIGSALWLVFYYKGIIRENKLSAEAVQLYSQADVKLCQGKLCVKTQPTPQEFRKDGYIIVAPKNGTK